MRDLILLAGEVPVESPEARPGHPARVMLNNSFVDLGDLPSGPEQALACGVARALAGYDTGKGVDILMLGKPGARLSANWNPGHANRLFAKSCRRVRLVLERGEHRLAGLLWIGRGYPAPRAKLMTSLFSEMIEALRMAIGAPNLPVCTVCGERGGADYTNSVTLRNVTSLSRRRIDEASGAALAEALYGTAHEVPSAFRRHIRWLWQGEMYQAWLSEPLDAEDHYLVSFPYAHGALQDGWSQPGFGQSAYEKRGVKSIIIRSRQSNWFQDEEILDLGLTISGVLPERARVTAYGASMGGYGALLLSGMMGADRVVAVAPQFSLDPDIVPFEKRWRMHRDRIAGYVHDMSAMVNENARKVIFYDHLHLDRRHVALLQPDDRYDLFGCPGAEHQILSFLRETGQLSAFMDAVCTPDADFSHIWNKARRNRTDSPTYWLSMFRRAKFKRPECAVASLRRCIEIEGPKPKYIKRLRAYQEPDTRSRSQART